MFLSKDKNGYYYVYYAGSNGKRNKISTKAKSKSDALKFLFNFNENNKSKAENISNPVSLAQFREEILLHSKTVHSPKTTDNYRTTFKSLLKHFGDVTLASLKKPDIENYIEKRIRETSVYAGRKDLAYLSASFRYAIDRKYVSENLCHGIRTPRIPEKMPLYFSKEEFDLLISCVQDKDMADLINFGANTGCRQGEVVGLRWNQVDLSQRRLILDNRAYMTKSKRIRTIPLNKVAHEIISRRRGEVTGEFVFTLEGKPVRPDRMNKLFKKYVINAKLNPRLHFHCLRHSFASWLVMRGVSLYQVQRLLGHSTSTVTQIYSHLSTDNLAMIVERLADQTN